MKILTNGKDISELIGTITWSGDTKQVARTIKFTIAHNRHDSDFPKVSINEGDKVVMMDDNGKKRFIGIIFDIDKTGTSNFISYLAYDLMFYINNSDVNKIFDGTPESITKEICNTLGISAGSLAKTGVKVHMPCFGKKAYEAIMMAYTVAARKKKTKYMPMMEAGTKVCVVEKGKKCGAILTGSYNLVEASYKSTLQNLVNRVLIVNKKNNVVKKVEDATSIKKYGLVQKVLKQEEKEDATAEAKAMLKTTEVSATVTGVPNDFRAVSGYSIVIRDKDTGLYGKFYIESDSHTFSAGKAQMDLTLAFENLMDEKEIDKDSD